MKKEELKALKIEGPLHFERLNFIKTNNQKKKVYSGLAYRKAIKGYSQIKHFYKQSIRLIND